MADPSRDARILGIVGGTGPESTLDYYRTLISIWRERGPAGTFPRVVINSVEGGEVIRLLGQGDQARVAGILSLAVRQLSAAGAGVGILASNACHLAFGDIEASAPIPLIHIVDAAAHAARSAGHRRLGIMGTRFVMQAPLYQEILAAAGIAVVVPHADEQAYVHDKYLGELVPGLVSDTTREGLVRIIAAMRDREGIDGMILGGTELALILSEPSYAGVPMVNTARIHVEAGVDWLLGHDTRLGASGVSGP